MSESTRPDDDRGGSGPFDPTLVGPHTLGRVLNGEGLAETLTVLRLDVPPTLAPFGQPTRWSR